MQLADGQQIDKKECAFVTFVHLTYYASTTFDFRKIVCE